MSFHLKHQTRQTLMNLKSQAFLIQYLNFNINRSTWVYQVWFFKTQIRLTIILLHVHIQMVKPNRYQPEQTMGAVGLSKTLNFGFSPNRCTPTLNYNST